MIVTSRDDNWPEGERYRGARPPVAKLTMCPACGQAHDKPTPWCSMDTAVVVTPEPEEDDYA